MKSLTVTTEGKYWSVSKKVQNQLQPGTQGKLKTPFFQFSRFDRVLLANPPGSSLKIKADCRKARIFFTYWCQKLLGKLEEDEKTLEAELKGKENFLKVIGVMHSQEVRFTLEQVIHMNPQHLLPEQAALVKWVFFP